MKPANILVDRTGKPYVTDFGLAIHEFSRHWNEGELAGTPAYMAPEQWDGKPCRESDVWALGVILYEMLTGERPFKGPRKDELEWQAREVEPPPPSKIRPEVEPKLDEICLHCLKKLPQERTTAEQLAKDPHLLV